MLTLGMPVFTSTDKGASWQGYRLPMPRSSFTPLGDPVLASDDKGNFYYSYLSGIIGSGATGVSVSLFRKMALIGLIKRRST